MASICPSNKRASDMYLPVYKLLSKKIQAGGRITDDGLSEELLRINGLAQGLPKEKMELFAKQDEERVEASCPRIRSYVDVGKCAAPQKIQQKWLQVSDSVPAECRRPCSAAPVELQGVHFVS